MFNNLPPILQDWITQLNNRSVSVNLRYNTYTMLSNIVKELKPHLEKFEKELEKVR